MESTSEEPYLEMRRHLPILRTVMKYLPGRDLINARLIDPYWKDAVDDTLHLLETIGESPLKPITFPRIQTFQQFHHAFSVPNPPNANRIFHFGNLKLNLGEIQFPRCEHCRAAFVPWLKFVTIGIPASTTRAFQHIKVLINNCPVLQKLALVNEWTETRGMETLSELSEPVVLGALPNLKRIGIDSKMGTWTGLDEFLGDVVNVAPNLRWSSVIYLGSPATGIPGMLTPLERTTFLKLDLGFTLLEGHGQQLFGELGAMDLKVWELSLTLLQYDPADQEGNGLGDWLAKIDSTGLQKLSLHSRNFLVHLPPGMNIRSLTVTGDFDRPVEPSQFPNLKELTIMRGSNSPRIAHQIHASAFAVGGVFPTVKKLGLELKLGYQNLGLEFAFPNVESLELRNALPFIPLEAVTNLRKLFQKSPNLVQLVIDFSSNSWDYNPAGGRNDGPWWALFTGGLLPPMNRYSGMERIYGQVPPAPVQDENGNAIPPIPSLFDLLPNLKSLELRNSPEILLYAVIHLTATQNIH